MHIPIFINACAGINVYVEKLSNKYDKKFDLIFWMIKIIQYKNMIMYTTGAKFSKV